jgi:hypothetical protein
MPDNIPSSGDRTIVVHRYGALTFISLALNALILLLILIGIVCNHHHRHHHKHGGWGNHHERQDWGNRGDGRGGFDRHEWNRGNSGGPRDADRGPGGECKPGQDGGGFGMKNDQPGWGGNKPGFGAPGMGGPGFGGMENHKPMTPPSAEAMSDRFMLILTEKLALTDQESAQIRPVVQQSIAQFQKDMEAQKQGHQKMIDDAKSKIRSTLDAGQQKQFDQMTAGFGTSAPSANAKPAPASK